MREAPLEVQDALLALGALHLQALHGTLQRLYLPALLLYLRLHLHPKARRRGSAGVWHQECISDLPRRNSMKREAGRRRSLQRRSWDLAVPRLERRTNREGSSEAVSKLLDQ